MLILDSIFLSSRIPDPTTTTKEKGEKVLFFPTFFDKFKIILFLVKVQTVFLTI